MSRPITTRDRLRYRFDATLSRGTVGIIGWLAVVTTIFVLVAGTLIVLLGIRADGETQTSFIEGLWLSVLRTLDPGTMGGDSGWRFRFIALGITIIGIFIVSTLIGLISTGIDRTVDELRKGRSLVVEEGHTFGDCLTLYESSAVIGVRAADGTVTLSPPMQRVFAEGDQVIAISADDDTIALNGEIVPGQAAATAAEPPLELKVERTLVIGWNVMAPLVLQELGRYVAPGSEVRVLFDPTRTEPAPRAVAVENMAIELVEMDTIDGQLLAAEIGRRAYDQVIILCYRNGDQAESDARTLLTLLQVRQATEQDGSLNNGVRLVTELLDVRDVELARIANPDDFVVSERLTSLMLAQLSENADLRGVFADLFDAQGVELVLVPASRYVTTGEEQSFADVVAAARRRGHVCVGYRRVGDDQGDVTLGGGVVLNPPKSKPVTFVEDDQILVLA